MNLFPPALVALAFLAGCPLPTPDEDTASDDTASDDTAADTDTDTSDTDTDTSDTDTDTDTALEPILASGFESSLDTTGGCTDTWMQAWDVETNVGLQVYRRGLLAAVVAAGAPVTETLFVGVDDVQVFVEVADPVAINYCTDALSERTVHEQWDAVSGTVVLTMHVPASEWAPGVLDVQLTDVVLDDGAGHAVTVSDASFTDVSIMRVWGG